MRLLTDYDRAMITAREYIDLDLFEAANAALDHIVPERRAEIPVLILRERIYRALGNVAGADRLAATLAQAPDVCGEPKHRVAKVRLKRSGCRAPGDPDRWRRILYTAYDPGRTELLAV